jgi:hypothetical protein
VKRRRLNAELTERQHLILALLLVILVAVSMLYCLGFASLAMRQTWEDPSLPWSETSLPEQDMEITPTVPPGQPILPP